MRRGCTRCWDIGPVTHSCATQQGPKCSSTSPQSGTPRSENLFISPVPRETSSLADKGFCPGSGKARRNPIPRTFAVPVLLLSSCPHTAPARGAMELGWHGPSSALHPRNTQPCWKERGEVYSDCGGAGSEAKRDGKFGMPADFNGKKKALTFQPEPSRRVGGCSGLSAKLEGSSPAQSSLNRALYPEVTRMHPALGAG